MDELEIWDDKELNIFSLSEEDQVLGGDFAFLQLAQKLVDSILLAAEVVDLVLVLG